MAPGPSLLRQGVFYLHRLDLHAVLNHNVICLIWAYAMLIHRYDLQLRDFVFVLCENQCSLFSMV